ncbi:MAG: radical SAM protein [Caldivirga sp.]
MVKEDERLDIILTTDRSMMTNHHGKEFLGFLTTGPIFVSLGPFQRLSEWFHVWLAAPKPKVDRLGRPREAPYGLRKIEAALIDAGLKAAIIDPDYVPRYIKNGAKVLMLSHHDYFGLNPPSSTWAVIVGKEPLNAYLFKKMMSNLKPYIDEAKKANGLKIFVGGPSAWQWLYFPELMNYYGVDLVFDGEGDVAVVDLAKRALNNEPLPRYVYLGRLDSPSIDEIRVIKGASVNGLVEIGRGCPRSCAFCSVTLRALRWYPLSKIEEELKVNVRNGVVNGLIHAEDVPLYGSPTVIPKPEKLIELHKLVKRYYKTVAWSHTTLAAVLYGEKMQGKLMSKIAEIIEDENQDWWGAQVGLETGSRRLAKMIMPGKAAPYKIENWWDVVTDALSIMHEIKLIPALTIIVGLPGETADDVNETIELIERIRPYRSLVVPLFYVPMNHIRTDKEGWLYRYNLLPEHIELLRVVFRHSVYWARDIVNKFYLRGPLMLPVRIGINYFINYIEKRVKEIEDRLDEIMANIRNQGIEQRFTPMKLVQEINQAQVAS